MSASTLARPDGTLLESVASPRLGIAPQDEKHVKIEVHFLSRSVQWPFVLQQGLKRAADILLAGAGLLVLSPVLVLIAALVYITDPGPIFYPSLRIGKNYKPFYMFKFRTMRVDADAQRETLRRQANLEGNLFKLKNDPRVTTFGRLLRATSLDELPQLVNVLLGQMSLVGPRPLPPDESDMFEEPYTLRYHVPPGITGIWQVSGRSQLDFQQLCQLELSYVMNWTFAQDMAILFKTLPAVLRKSGAY